MPHPRLRPLCILLALSLVPALFYARWIWRDWPESPFTPNRALVVRDYVNIWAGGTLARAGDLLTIFDPHRYDAWLKLRFGPTIDLHTFSYPPPLLLLAMPFSQLPLIPGFLAWGVATLAGLAGALRWAGLPLALIAALMVSPAAAENLLAGQNGALSAAALGGGLLLARRNRPLPAGLLLGLLLVKPQLGLLVPVCLLAARDWRAVLSTALAACAYAAVSLPIFGVEAWRLYAELTAPFMRQVMEAPFGLAYQLQMPSPFIAMRALGAGLGPAYAVQALTLLACVALVWMAWRPRASGRADGDAAVALALLLTPIATPYAHSYDLLTATVGVALLAPVALQEEGGWSRIWRRALAAAWLWPGMAFLVGAGFCPGLGWLVLSPAAVYAAMRAIGGPTRLLPARGGAEA